MVVKTKYSWNEILPEIEGVDNITLLQTLQTEGLPEDARDRTLLLKRFNVIKEGDYPINYEGLCNFSNAFNEAYPKSEIISLIQHVITGAKPFPMEINHANISDEEKALLFLVLPLSKTFTNEEVESQERAA